MMPKDVHAALVSWGLHDIAEQVEAELAEAKQHRKSKSKSAAK